MNYSALSASDGSGESVRAVVQATRSIGSSSITVNATTNWPTGTFIATTGTLQANGTLNPTTAQVFYGTASGTTITISSFAAGYSDLGNAIGDVVVIKPSTEWANIVAQGIQGITQFPANFVNFVESTGGIWTAGSGLVGSATAGNVWYAGTRSAMAAVSSHTFTASKDTYVDYNPSTAAWSYVAVSNGAAQPVITTGCVRITLVVTGASAISSVYQSEYSSPVPLVWKYLNSATITSGYTNTGGSTQALVTGLTSTVTLPTGVSKVKITVTYPQMTASSSGYVTLSIWNGTVGSGTQLTSVQTYITSSGAGQTASGTMTYTVPSPSAGSVTYNVGIGASAGNASFGAGTGTAGNQGVGQLLVECC